MFLNLTMFQSLMDNGVFLEKKELVKRYRLLGSANKGVLQFLEMLQFTFMGKDEKGRLYLC